MCRLVPPVWTTRRSPCEGTIADISLDARINRELSAAQFDATPDNLVAGAQVAMLVDVSGRVSLIKRDLAVRMRCYMPKPTQCPSQ